MKNHCPDFLPLRRKKMTLQRSRQKGKKRLEKRLLSAAVQYAQKPIQNVQEARDPVRTPSAKETAAAIKSNNSEVLGVLKELSSNQNEISDKLEKLSCRVTLFMNMVRKMNMKMSRLSTLGTLLFMVIGIRKSPLILI